MAHLLQTQQQFLRYWFRTFITLLAYYIFKFIIVVITLFASSFNAARRSVYIGRMQDAPEVSPQIVRIPRRSRLRSPAIALSLPPLCPSCRLVPLALCYFFIFFAPRTCQPISRNPSFSSAPREEGVYHRTGSCGRQRLPFDTSHYRAHTAGEPDGMRGRNS